MAITLVANTTVIANTGVAAGKDTLVSISGLIGSAFNDVLTGDTQDNVIEGGVGDDIPVGGEGQDMLSYASATAGITVALVGVAAQATGGAGSDTVSGFEHLIGSGFDDVLTGSALNNRIEGGGHRSDFGR